LKKQKGEAFIEQIVNNHCVYEKDLRTPILCDSIKHAHTTLFTDKKIFDDYIIYLDKTLRDSKTSVGEKVRLLYTAVGLVLYIKDKDIFLASYQKKMTQRLLSSVESEAESFMIEFLKTHIGMSAVHRIETMYKDSIKPVTNMFINHTLRTLNYASWSENTMPIPDWKIPSVLAPIADVFLSKENVSKKLTWLPAHDTITLQTTFSGKPYTLVMTSIQASVVMLFDEGVQLLEADIQEKTGIPTYAMKSVLHSIVSSRVPLLDVTEGVYKLVEKPRTNLLHIKLPRPQVVQPPDRRLVADVHVEREYSTDSAIVRILKSRKRAAYTEVQMEVVKQLSHLFVPEVPLIKRRIESLIDRDYIERDDADSSYLLYVA
jgi:cullin 1